jgi:hypothetical protein
LKSIGGRAPVSRATFTGPSRHESTSEIAGYAAQAHASGGAVLASQVWGDQNWLFDAAGVRLDVLSTLTWTVIWETEAGTGR